MYSNTHKFIFVHAGKCAGTSIKRALRSIKGLEVQCFRGHLSLSEMKKSIQKDGFSPEDYFKFSVTRNPWDRHLSLYYHMRTIKNRPIFGDNLKLQFDGTFEEYIFLSRNHRVNMAYEKMDFVIKYENLEKDFEKLCNLLGLPSLDLMKIDYDTGRPKVDYRSYYNEETKEIVAKIYQHDIDLFGYEF